MSDQPEHLTAHPHPWVRVRCKGANDEERDHLLYCIEDEARIAVIAGEADHALDALGGKKDSECNRIIALWDQSLKDGGSDYRLPDEFRPACDRIIIDRQLASAKLPQPVEMQTALGIILVSLSQSNGERRNRRVTTQQIANMLAASEDYATCGWEALPSGRACESTGAVMCRTRGLLGIGVATVKNSSPSPSDVWYRLSTVRRRSKGDMARKRRELAMIEWLNGEGSHRAIAVIKAEDAPALAEILKGL